MATGDEHTAATQRAEVLALASPPCHKCGTSVQRLEMRWHRDEDRVWRVGPWYLVCADGHRVAVEPLA
jgi:hypothetical protein